MAVTVSDVERILDGRAHGLLLALGMSTATDGTNPSLSDPITWGMGRMGIVPATGLVITDDDLLAPKAGTIYRGIDYAEYRLLTNMTMSDTFADTRVGNGSVMLSQVLAGLERRIDRLGKRLGVSMQPLVGGSIVKRLDDGLGLDELATGRRSEGSP